jgi:hypothetical protein
MFEIGQRPIQPPQDSPSRELEHSLDSDDAPEDKPL